MDKIRMRYSPIRMAAGGEAEMLLYGEIISDMPEDWKWSKEDKSAADFDKAIKQARADGAVSLLLRVNCPGGLVHEAVAMRSILQSAGFESIRVRIEGLCASAATLIASIPGAVCEIAEGSEYMIHNPWSWAFGNAEDMEHEAEHLRQLEKTSRDMYAQKCKQPDEQLKEWMDKETWFTAQDAVKYGFCDSLLENKNAAPAAACVTGKQLKCMKAMYRNTPDSILTQDGDNGNNGYAPVADKILPKEENGMDIKDVTLDLLKTGNSAVYQSILDIGAQQERERIQDIRDLTSPGYETMADDAIKNGVSAMDFHKSIVKAQREKGEKYISARAEETAPAAQVAGESVENPAGDMDAFLRDVKELANAEHREMNGGMY